MRVGKFVFPLRRSPTVVSELGSCVDVFSSRTQKFFVGGDVRFAALLSLFLIPRYCWIEAAWTDITRTLTRDWIHRYE